MHIREIWGKFTLFIFWNFPLKHVITSTSYLIFLIVKLYIYNHKIKREFQIYFRNKEQE